MRPTPPVSSARSPTKASSTSSMPTPPASRRSPMTAASRLSSARTPQARQTIKNNVGETRFRVAAGTDTATAGNATIVNQYRDGITIGLHMRHDQHGGQREHHQPSFMAARSFTTQQFGRQRDNHEQQLRRNLIIPADWRSSATAPRQRYDHQQSDFTAFGFQAAPTRLPPVTPRSPTIPAAKPNSTPSRPPAMPPSPPTAAARRSSSTTRPAATRSSSPTALASSIFRQLGPERRRPRSRRARSRAPASTISAPATRWSSAATISRPRSAA